MMIIVMAQLFLNDVIMTINDKKKLIAIYDNDVDRIIVVRKISIYYCITCISLQMELVE